MVLVLMPTGNLHYVCSKLAKRSLRFLKRFLRKRSKETTCCKRERRLQFCWKRCTKHFYCM